MIPESIRKQSFWLFGVIVGLAIKEAITAVLPHFFDEPYDTKAKHFPELWRLFVFLILGIRFYLGATRYFDEGYEKLHPPPEGAPSDTPPQNKYKTKNFGVDFLFGFFHFIVFSALALSIKIHTGQPQDEMRQSLFLILLVVILVYDVFWLAFNCLYDTFHLIKKWAVLNIVNVVVAGVVYFAIWLYYRLNEVAFDYLFAESAVLLIVVLFSTVDIIELILGHPVISRSLGWLGDAIRSIGN